MSTTAENAIAELLRTSPSLLFQAATRMHHSPSSTQQQRYDEAEVQQMTDGFTALLIEALDGKSRQVHTMVMETMIPGLLERGETAVSIIGWNASFIALLSCEVARGVPEALRSDAIDWLASFAGVYVADVARAAGAPQ